MRLAVLRPLLAFVVVLLATGCSAVDGPPTSPGPASTGPSAVAPGSPTQGSTEPAGSAVWLPPWADDAPAAVIARRPLPFCGVEQSPAPQPGFFVDRAVRLCFWNAHLGHTEAEYASVQTTIEGDPIAMIYRLSADGTVEVLTDFTQDDFGPGTWELSTCARVVEGEGDELLGVADCAESQTVR